MTPSTQSSLEQAVTSQLIVYNLFQFKIDYVIALAEFITCSRERLREKHFPTSIETSEFIVNYMKINYGYEAK